MHRINKSDVTAKPEEQHHDSSCEPVAADGTASRPIQIDEPLDQDGSEGPSNATSLNMMPKKNRAEKHFLHPAASRTTKKKQKTNDKEEKPKFESSHNDPFESTPTRVCFIIRGKPLPQYRDKPGWNFTRYNPSKKGQNNFRQVAAELCRSNIGRVPTVGCEVHAKVTCHFCFPFPRKGLLKNTADIDNLSKFVLDACNKTFYGDDRQVVSLVADKAFDGSYGGAGYTIVTIEAMDGAVFNGM
jgi:Holliday junction resolvase RusA-like endonuclease